MKRILFAATCLALVAVFFLGECFLLGKAFALAERVLRGQSASSCRRGRGVAARAGRAARPARRGCMHAANQQRYYRARLRTIR